MVLTKARLLKHDFPVHGKLHISCGFLISQGVNSLIQQHRWGLFWSIL